MSEVEMLQLRASAQYVRVDIRVLNTKMTFGPDGRGGAVLVGHSKIGAHVCDVRELEMPSALCKKAHDIAVRELRDFSRHVRKIS